MKHFYLFCALGMTFLSGCGNGNRLQGLVPVEGIVYYDGKPLDGATVQFYPVDPQKRTAVGITDADGKFVMTTLQPNDGVFPGEYKTGVMKFSDAPAVTVNVSDNELARMQAAADAKDNIKPLIPVKYSMPEQSGLTVSVPKGGVKNIKFELTQ